MALIVCPECGKKISDKAHACPSCGYPVDELALSELLSVDDTFCAEPKRKSKNKRRVEARISSDEKSCESESEANPRRTGARIVLVIMLAFGVLAVAGLIRGISLSAASENTDHRQSTSQTAQSASGGSTGYQWHDDSDAFYCACEIVKNDLKAPSTASFCKQSEAQITYLGDGEYMVTGWVDAENGYGAMIRSNFIATYTATKDGYSHGNAIIE